MMVTEALLKAVGASETSWLARHFASSSFTWLKVAAHYLIGIVYLDGIAGLQYTTETK